MKKSFPLYLLPFIAGILPFPSIHDSELISSISKTFTGESMLSTKKKTPLPWEEADKKHLRPSVPHIDYTPTVVPNGKTARYHVVDGVKIFHLTASEINWEVGKGLVIKAWGFNGSIPGPLIEVCEGDRVKIYVTNNLPSPTTVHWHGVLLQCGMDGVSGVTQPPIFPGQTYLYEFIFQNSGTFMYHPHYDGMTDEGMGLVGMIVVHKREKDITKRPDRDFSIMLHEWQIKVGTARPNTLSPSFNVVTMNGKVMPDTEPLVAEIGDKIWIRYGNLSAMDHHPIHLHGYSFKIIGTDGGWAKDPSLLLPETTVLVPTGSAKVIEFLANNPGDWVFHCHMTHHTMNQMGHEFQYTEGVIVKDFNDRVRKLIPEYKMLGTTGMKNMTTSGLPIPENSIPMMGLMGRWGNSTTFGGMANILRVREKTDNYKDPGPYRFPKNTRAREVSTFEMEEDGIIVR